MSQRLGGRHARVRIPVEAALDEVEKERIVAALERLRPVARAGQTARLAASRLAAVQRRRAVGQRDERAVARIALGADEVARSLGGVHDLGRRHAAQLDDAGELVGLVLARKERIAGEQLGYDAAETPHVDGHAVLGAEYDLGRSIEARLYVGVDALMLVAAGAVVDDLDAAAALLLEQYVLGLEVAVDDLALADGVQAE